MRNHDMAVVTESPSTDESDMRICNKMSKQYGGLLLAKHASSGKYVNFF